MSNIPNAILRQPNTIDTFQVNKFRLTIHKYPYLEYFCQKANIPGLDIPEFNQPSYHTAIMRPATTVTYDKLEVTFLVTEDMLNWLQIQDWMTKLVPTRSFRQVIQPEKDVYSDITLNILSAKYNRVMEVNFKQCWPKTLTGIQLDTTTPDSSIITATVTFSHAGCTFVHKDTNKEIPVA